MWKLKAIIQKICGIVPFGTHLNYFFQKHITKGVVLSDFFFEDVLTHFKALQQQLHDRDATYSLKNKRVLEIGTGWHPIMGIAFYLSGAELCYTADLKNHLKANNFITSIRFFVRYAEQGLLQHFLPDIQQDRLEKLKSLLVANQNYSTTQLAEQVHLKQIIGNLCKPELVPEELDLVFSINTLEHIDKNELPLLFSNLKQRIKTPGHFQLHTLGMFDHFIHVDKSIHRLNYLRFSAQQWKWIDNSIQPQNRLRITDFIQLFETTGYEVIGRIVRMFENAPLPFTPHPEFNTYPVADLLVPYSSVLLVAKHKAI